MIDSEGQMQGSDRNLINSPEQEEEEVINIACLMDTGRFHWVKEILDFTVNSLLANHSDGWYDDLLPNATLTYSLHNSSCDQDEAVQAYLNVTRESTQLHGIIGCRCSGPSMAVARLCSLEDIPIVSPTATSGKLSDKEVYGMFSRLAAPDNEKGQVGALVALMRSLGWSRISIINTDTQYTRDIALELSSAWKRVRANKDPFGEPFQGEVAYTDTIKFIRGVEELDLFSVEQVLSGIPVDDPSRNSRVIVLFAHHQHAFPILKKAQEMNIQPDTIWLGVSGWIGRVPVDGDTSWMPEIPGYMGVVPYRDNQSPAFFDFLSRLQEYQRQHGRNVTEDLYGHEADRFADSILATAMAFHAVGRENRYNGRMVVDALRNLSFTGLAGPVSFTKEGDLDSPGYTVLTKRTAGPGWQQVGVVFGKDVDIDRSKLCFPVAGCGAQNIPSDRYPLPKIRLQWWIWFVICVLGVVCVLFIKQKLKTRSVKEKLRQIEAELDDIDNSNVARKQKKARLYQKIADLLQHPMPEHWTDAHGLVKVPPTTQEYWDVLDRLRETMSDSVTCYISELSRVQNAGIWSYYVFRKHQLANKYGTSLKDTNRLNEITVWHGTSSLNPDVIYNDNHDGFMMQLSQQGHWGRGIYFAERSGYSDHYAFKPLNEYSNTDSKDREMFLVKLLAGDVKVMDRNANPAMEEVCKDLVTPPYNDDTKSLYDTVMGIVDDEYNTKVYVVYENGRAYPEYLVRYYLGQRDPERTPFDSLQEALLHKKERKENLDTVDSTPTSTASINAEAEPEEMKDIEQKKKNQHVDDSPKPNGHPYAQQQNIPHDYQPRQIPQVVQPNTPQVANASASPPGTSDDGFAVWEFLGDNGWISYDDLAQMEIEGAFKRDPRGKITIQGFPFRYELDLERRTQRNMDHPAHTTRKIRRHVLH